MKQWGIPWGSLSASYIPHLELKKPATQKYQQAETESPHKSAISSQTEKGKPQQIENFQTIITHLYPDKQKPSAEHRLPTLPGFNEAPRLVVKKAEQVRPHQVVMTIPICGIRGHQAGSQDPLQGQWRAVTRHPYPSRPERHQHRSCRGLESHHCPAIKEPHSTSDVSEGLLGNLDFYSHTWHS